MLNKNIFLAGIHYGDQLSKKQVPQMFLDKINWCYY